MTNCMVLAQHAPNIPSANFTALTRLDFNRFSAQVPTTPLSWPNYLNALYHRSTI